MFVAFSCCQFMVIY